MPTVVNLKVKEEDAVKTVPFEVDGLTLLQYEDMMKVINDILKETKEDRSVLGLFDFVNSSENEDEFALDMEFISIILNSFETIAIKMPSHALKLVSVLSGIPLEIIRQQKFESVFDIYDAIIEENDIEKIIKRVKKSLALTQAKVKFKAMFSKKETTTQA